MGLLAEIQHDAISDTTPASTLLRKCFVLAHNLDSNLLEDWVRHELNGYPKDAEVPDYRRIPMHFKANLTNLVYSVTNQPVPQALVAKAVGNSDIATFKCRQAIGTISEDKIKDSSTLVVNFDNIALLLERKGIFDSSYSVSQFWGEVPAPSVLGVVDAVRNRVLEFALALSKKYPSAGEVGGVTMKEPALEKTVNQIFNTTINGNAGVIGNADNATVNIRVGQGNFDDLRQQLIQHGIGEEDIWELEAAIASEPQIGTGKKYGPKVAQWVGKMLGKAASGVWGVGLQTGGVVLEKALLKYYGLE
ncbi:AbiTii domain-containing protein [Sinorhizobium meliloti]